MSWDRMVGAALPVGVPVVAGALYWVGSVTGSAARVPLRAIGWGGAAVVLFLLVAGAPATAGGGVLPFAVLGVALCATAWTAGRAVRERRVAREAAARQLAARAVADERLRIARELHDVVAHHVGVIAVQAGVARHVGAARPEESGRAMAVIEGASRQAMAEMRQMLGVLRGGAEGPQGVEPPPGLARLPELLERAAAAGVTVVPRTSGLAGLPEGVDRSAFRLVQEALTNVMKHAAPTRCALEVTAGGGALRIEVADEGGPGRPGGGHGADAAGGAGGAGLIGMRERVALYGGEFRAGPRPGGGFTVRAVLPLDAEAGA
ncbi:sensor histidine kinase [Streptomyces ginkgonis]|uniref:sensor histidine kinase n=1 Tax=Streptomyces ginkgonis TaxID=1812259 RepID=UPI002176A56F|nr:histidine kinase [Streptomyces ginkgonis]